MQKGIKKEDIEKAFYGAEYVSGDGALTVAEKYMKGKERTRENKTKTYRYLAGKGYDYDDINSALDKLFKEE